MTAARVHRADLEDLNAYDQRREQAIVDAIALKKLRRVELGDRVSRAFECRATVLFQIHEMLRAERISEEARIREEIAVHNDLMPGGGELSAMLFIEITSQDRVQTELDSLLGLEQHLWLEVGDDLRLQAWFEPGHSREDRISAVHYVRFKLSPSIAQAFRAGRAVTISLDHPHDHARTELPRPQAAELAKDLA